MSDVKVVVLPMHFLYLQISKLNILYYVYLCKIKTGNMEHVPFFRCCDQSSACIGYLIFKQTNKIDTIITPIIKMKKTDLAG